jgi:hypothetical protein
VRDATRYWPASVIAEIQSFGHVSVVATLSNPENGATPSMVSIYSDLGERLDHDDPKASIDARFEGALSHLWDADRTVVMLVNGMERWNDPKYEDEAFAFRAFIQTNQDRLFPILVCADHETWRRQFLTESAPLYHEGLMVRVSKEGMLI